MNYPVIYPNHELTDREVFDIVAGWLTRPNATPSRTTDDYMCAYRGFNGNRCAIGILITDQQYKREMEGEDAESLFDNFGFEPFPQLTNVSKCLLKSLQHCHDHKSTHHFQVEEWRSWIQVELKSIANDHGFEWRDEWNTQ